MWVADTTNQILPMKEILPKPGKKWLHICPAATKMFPSELDSSRGPPSWRIKEGLIFQSPHIPADILTDSSWAVSFWMKHTDCLKCCWFLRDEKRRGKPPVRHQNLLARVLDTYGQRLQFVWIHFSPTQRGHSSQRPERPAGRKTPSRFPLKNDQML